MSLRLRLTLWYGLLLALSLAAFGTLLYVVLKANLEQQLDEALGLRGAQVVRSVTLGPNGQLDASDLGPDVLNPRSVDEATGPDLYVQVYNHRAEPIAASGSALPMDPGLVLEALAGHESLTTLPLGGSRAIRLLTRPVAADGQVVGVVQVGDTLDGVIMPLRQVRDILAIGSLVVLVAAGLGGLWLGGRALAPVQRVSATARRIAETGDYAQRLPDRRSRDEIGELIATFNALIERVERSLGEQRRFLADTSHELRSPLTVIRANLGFLRRDADPDTRAECIREAEAEAARMSRLVTDLLLLGQDPSAELLRRGPVSLDELVVEVREQASVQADGRRVELGPVERCVVLADRDRLKQVVWNLAENAIRYTPAGGTIRLSLHHVDGWAELAVADDGLGIAPEHLPRVFERFYRVDKARARATGGAGLGLAIVKHIARAHGGTVAVESAPGEGSTFRVRLPMEQPKVQLIEVTNASPGIALSSPAYRGS